jgi:hypothetical protein
MKLPDGIHPDERILLLGIPEPALISSLASSLTGGLLVAVGDETAVREARKAAHLLDNVMFVPGTPDDLPWRDGFFTRVIDVMGGWPDPDKVRLESERVTHRSQSV